MNHWTAATGHVWCQHVWEWQQREATGHLLNHKILDSYSLKSVRVQTEIEKPKLGGIFYIAIYNGGQRI